MSYASLRKQVGQSTFSWYNLSLVSVTPQSAELYTYIFCNKQVNMLRHHAHNQPEETHYAKQVRQSAKIHF